MNKIPFLSVNDITIRNGNSFFFENTSWTFFTNQQWLIYGSNGSGKSTFAKAIAGLLPTKQGKIILNFVNDNLPFPSVHKNKIAYLSFETQQNLLNKDSIKMVLESYVGIESKGSLVRNFVKNSPLIDQLAEYFSIDKLLDHEIATLSTG